MEVAIDTDQMSPLALAYIGDAVYELFVRQHLISQGVVKVNDLHRQAVKLVKATAQSHIIHQLEGQLTDAELRMVKRGRNAKSGKTPKNTELIDYRYSTGFECLLGYLHLTQQQQRLEEILNRIPQIMEEHYAISRSEQ